MIDLTFDSISHFLSTAALSTLIIWYLHFQWNRRTLYKMTRNIPGPSTWPIIGSSFKFMLKCNNFLICQTLLDLFKQYKGIFGVWHGPFLLCGIVKPEYLQIVLTSTKTLNKPYIYEFMEPTIGQGLVTANMPIWKRHRKIINPAFNQNILNSFMDVFVEKSVIMGQVMEKELGNEEFDVFKYCEKCTLDVVCETALGVKVNTQTIGSDVHEWVQRLMEITWLRMFSLRYHFDLIFKWTQLHKEFENNLKKFLTFSEKIVQDKKLEHEKRKKIGFTNINGTKRKALIELLIQYNETDDDKNKLSDEELRDEVNTFMLAGSDTTASSISFVFCMLGMHQDIQQKVYEEIMDVLGPDRLLQLEDLQHFKFTERVIKESMRLFPVVPFIQRIISEDLRLDQNIVLPKDSGVGLGILPMHRSPEYYPDPLKFNPDRFLPEEIAKRHPFAYLPFVAGPRVCIGYKFAMMLMTTMIVLLVRKYQFQCCYKSVEDIKLEVNVTLRIVDGFMVSIKKRK